MSNINIDIDHEKKTATITASGVLNAEFYALLKGVMELVPKHYSVEGFTPASTVLAGVEAERPRTIGIYPEYERLYEWHNAKCQYLVCGETAHNWQVNYGWQQTRDINKKHAFDAESEPAEPRKPKRIRITGGQSWCWYKDSVGGSFDIFEDGDDTESPTHYYVDPFMTVLREDAEVIEWHEPEGQ